MSNHIQDNVASEPASNTAAIRTWSSTTRLIIRPLSEVQVVERRWLWPGRIPIGHISGLTGDPGVGKTHMLLSLAAVVVAGEEWPDGAVSPKGRVLIIDGENGEVEIKRRLEAQHFEGWEEILVMSDVEQAGQARPFNLTLDLTALEAHIAELKPVWVIIDPLVAFHGKDENKATDVRALLRPLAQLADRAGIAITFVQHPNKNVLAPTQYRVRGSLDFVAAARAILRVELSDDHQTRLLHVDKLNLGPIPAPIAFRIDDGWIEWLGPQAPFLGKSQREQAKELIGNILRHGPEEANTIQQALELSGVSKRTGERAKAELNVRSVKDGPDGAWYWELPQNGATQNPDVLGALG